MNRDRAMAIMGKVFSPSVMFWLMAAWLFLYATLAIWTREAFAGFMGRLSGDPFVQIPFVLFIAVAFVNYATHALARLRASLLSAPIWLMAPTGALLFLTGFYISAVLSDSGKIFVGTSDVVQPPWQQGRYIVSEIDTALRDEVVDTGEGTGTVFRYSPRLYLVGEGKRHEVGVFPPTRVENTYYHIMDFGLAPVVRTMRDGRVLNEGSVIQRILPPGIRDSFDLPGLPYRFALKLLPASETTRGTQILSVYDLRAPLYSVVVEKGQNIVFEGDSSGPVEFDGIEMEFVGMDYWFWLEGARNPGYLILATGILLLVTGVPLMFAAMGYRTLFSMASGHMDSN